MFFCLLPRDDFGVGVVPSWLWDYVVWVMVLSRMGGTMCLFSYEYFGLILSRSIYILLMLIVDYISKKIRR